MSFNYYYWLSGVVSRLVRNHRSCDCYFYYPRIYQLSKFANHENLHTMFKYTLIFLASIDILGCEKKLKPQWGKLHFSSKDYSTKNWKKEEQNYIAPLNYGAICSRLVEYAWAVEATIRQDLEIAQQIYSTAGR